MSRENEITKKACLLEKELRQIVENIHDKDFSVSQRIVYEVKHNRKVIESMVGGMKATLQDETGEKVLNLAKIELGDD